jgi:hypothetical protein
MLISLRFIRAPQDERSGALGAPERGAELRSLPLIYSGRGKKGSKKGSLCCEFSYVASLGYTSLKISKIYFL